MDDRFVKADPPVSKTDNAKKGYLWWFLSLASQLVLASCLNTLYKLNPTLGVFPALILRGIISTFIMLLILRGQIFQTLTVQRDQIPGLTFRIVQGTFSVILTFYTLKYFSPTIYRTFDSIQPLLVVLLGALLLRE